ncbi:MAG: YqaJ viral recombinase family protein [Actinomycetota bacterium]
MDVVDEETWRAEWLAWRAQGIGASDVAAAATGRYGGAYKVVASKLGLAEPVEETDQMRRGHRWEPRIAELIHAATGLHVVGEQTLVEDPDRPHRRCTPDGFIADATEVSIADVLAVSEMKTWGTDVRPVWDYYEAQTRYQCGVTGLERALLAVAEVDDTTDQLVSFDLRWIEAHPFDVDPLLELADELWSMVRLGELPTPTGDELDMVKALHADADTEAPEIALDADQSMAAHRLHELRAAGRRIDSEARDLEAELRHTIGATTTAVTLDGWTVKVGAPSNVLTAEAEAEILTNHPHLARPAALDRDRAKAELGSKVLDTFRRPVGSRRLTIRPPKGPKR